MKRLAGLLPLFATALLLLAGCDAAEDDTSGLVTIHGQVLNAETRNPIEGAIVRVLPYGLEYLSDTQGKFVADVEIDSTMDLRVVAQADKFTQAEAAVLAIAGRTISDVYLNLRQTVADGPSSGRPSNILLEELSAPHLSVRETGGQEVANITFVVADSAGNPVVLDQAAEVAFRLAVTPGGGEYLSPARAMPDNNGRVTVNLSSGTRAGVVQIIAETEVDGRTVRSKPATIAIHGGHPDQTHFTIAPKQFNFPGLVRYNEVNPITVIVGDRYGNPAKPETAVYFTADYGLVDGSVHTNDNGQGSVNFYSANPLPYASTGAGGFATITATTADEEGRAVSAQTSVLLSGHIAFDVEPQVARFGKYTLRVRDVENGRPLAPGTSISVRAEGTKVKAVGSTNVTLGDYTEPGPGVTEFTFSVAEDLRFDEDGSPTVETVTITVAGPNGNLEVTLAPPGGVAQVQSPSDFVVERAGSGLNVRLEE